MKVHWIIEGGIFGDEGYHLELEAVRQGHVVTSTPKNPFFTDERLDHLNLLLDFDIRTVSDRCVLYRGSCSSVGWIQQNSPAEPGAAWSPRHKFFCTGYYANFGKYMMNSPYVFVQVSELKRMLDFYFDTFGYTVDGESKIFVKSDSGSKVVSGGLMSKSDIKGHFGDLKGNEVMPYDDVMLLIAMPKNISREFRFVVSDGKVLTGGQYLPITSNIVPDYVSEYADEVLENMTWDPDGICKMWTLDIAELESTRCQVIEINSFNSSGLYGLDTEAIVREASRLAAEDFEEYGKKTE